MIHLQRAVKLIVPFPVIMNIPFMIMLGSVANTRVSPHQFLEKLSFTFTTLSHLKRIKSLAFLTC